MSREKFIKNKQINLNFANGLKTLRKQHGLNQNDIAVRIGIKKAAMSNLENAITDPSLSTAVTLAAVFGLTPEQVMAVGSGEPAPVNAALVLPAWLDELLPILRALSPKDQDLLIKFIKALVK